jgi:hypothetical protein
METQTNTQIATPAQKQVWAKPEMQPIEILNSNGGISDNMVGGGKKS